MCGIAGCIIDKKLPETIISNLLNLMKKRGPDAQKYKIFNFANKYLYLFHSRLSIIDVDSRSHQPFSINGYHLIFNGEIYNYLEIKEKYLDDVIFETDSDTEVLLQLYIKYPNSFEDKLEGMWSLVIYDEKKNHIYFSRDRFGEKPLYYYFNSNILYFGSEIKFIKTLVDFNLKINNETIKRFLIYGYKSIHKSEKNSFYEDIKILKPSSSMIINRDLKINYNKHWSISNKENNFSISENIERVKELLTQSVKLRLRSDVPLAFNLSGGIDSNSIIALAKYLGHDDLHTFSVIDDDERYNEIKNINLTIGRYKTNHTNVNISDYLNFNTLEDLIEAHDQPISTINYFAHSILQQKINQSGFKVSLSGTAADELFAGYWDHHLFYLYEENGTSSYKFSLNNWKNFILPNIENPFLKNPNLLLDKGLDFRGHIYLNSDHYKGLLNDQYEENLFDQKYNFKSPLKNRMLNELFHEITPICLQNEDINSMLYSVENRSPFLDKNLVEFTYSIPTKFYIQNGFSKFILRESMKGLINDEIRLDRRKRGFNCSISSLFKDKDLSKKFLNKDSPIYEIFNKKKIIEYFDLGNFSNNYDKKFIFNFINCKIFMEIN